MSGYFRRCEKIPRKLRNTEKLFIGANGGREEETSRLAERRENEEIDVTHIYVWGWGSVSVGIAGLVIDCSCLDAIKRIYYFMFDKAPIASVYFKKLLGAYNRILLLRRRITSFSGINFITLRKRGTNFYFPTQSNVKFWYCMSAKGINVMKSYRNQAQISENKIREVICIFSQY